jgi:hypothetical protein
MIQADLSHYQTPPPLTSHYTWAGKTTRLTKRHQNTGGLVWQRRLNILHQGHEVDGEKMFSLLFAFIWVFS